MNTNVRVFGHGHRLGGNDPGRPTPPSPTRSILVKRRWRLGDIIMCEPVCRELSAHGASLLFATGTEYHAIVQCFSGSPPRT